MNNNDSIDVSLIPESARQSLGKLVVDGRPEALVLGAGFKPLLGRIAGFEALVHEIASVGTGTYVSDNDCQVEILRKLDALKRGSP